MLQTIVTDDEVNIVIAQQHLCGSHAVRCDHHRTARALSDQQRFVAAGGGIGIGAHRKRIPGRVAAVTPADDPGSPTHCAQLFDQPDRAWRSEEKTSELQSIMRCSYADV